MSFSYSKVDTFFQCPYKFKLRYIDKLEPLPDMSPGNALYVGTAAHTGIEKRSVEAAIESYKSHYDTIEDLHNIEILKLKTILPKAIEVIPEGEYEHRLNGKDGFIGFIDCLVPVSEGVYDLLDFKCSNNVSGYKKSAQVHIYKYYYESLTGNKIRDMYYVFIPKPKVKLTEDISIDDYKTKVVEELSNADIHFEKIEFDLDKVNDFFNKRDKMESATVFEKFPTGMCAWCDYKKYCKSNGRDKSEILVKSQVVEEVKLF